MSLPKKSYKDKYLFFARQTPLKELLVFHADAQYLADVKSLQRYIESELNVRDVIFTSDEELTGVRYRAVADWAVLGRKLRKDLARVKNNLPKVPSADVQAYTQTGKLVVDGIELVAGDLTVQRYIELPAGSENKYATHTDNDVVVRLDVQIYPELQGEWLTREMINRVQKLRKKAGLQATDDVEVYYTFTEGEGQEILEAIQNNEAVIIKAMRRAPVNGKNKPADAKVLLEEEQEVADTKFILALVPL
jgi:isoleucyl-tRNA synthetase